MMFILKRRTKLQAQHFVIANFDAYQDGALTEADTAFYRQHLASCQKCRDWESRQVRLIEQLGIELSPPSRLSPTAVDRMYQNLYRRKKWRNLMNITRSFLGTVAAVAIIAIAVGVFIWW
jgi:predicted anti-sigma-YlaC factor YlaD